VRTRQEFPVGAYIIEVIDIIAGITFIAGSVCFIPAYSANVPIFLTGCLLFIVGSVLYFFVCLFCVIEALQEKGHYTFEVGENVLYLIGCFIFFLGTILYMPQEEEKCDNFLKQTNM